MNKPIAFITYLMRGSLRVRAEASAAFVDPAAFAARAVSAALAALAACAAPAASFVASAVCAATAASAATAANPADLAASAAKEVPWIYGLCYAKRSLMA